MAYEQMWPLRMECHRRASSRANMKMQEILPAVSREKELCRDQKKAIISIFFQFLKNLIPQSYIFPFLQSVIYHKCTSREKVVSELPIKLLYFTVNSKTVV